MAAPPDLRKYLTEDELKRVLGVVKSIRDRAIFTVDSICTHLVSKDVDVLAIKDWVGHRDIRSTLVYTQIRNAQRNAAAQKVYEKG